MCSPDNGSMSTKPEVEHKEYGVHPLAWLMYIAVAVLVVTAIALPFFVSLNLWVYIPIAYVIVALAAAGVIMQEPNNSGWCG